MSKKWRPIRWNNPYVRTASNPIPKNLQDDTDEAYEAGADAMLEAMRKNGVKFYRGFEPFSLKGYSPQKGLFVFIPDDAPDDRRQADPLPYKIAGYCYNTPAKISGEVVEEGYFCVGCGQRIVPKIDQNHMCRDKKGISYQETWIDDGSSYWQTCRPRP